MVFHSRVFALGAIFGLIVGTVLGVFLGMAV